MLRWELGRLKKESYRFSDHIRIDENRQVAVCANLPLCTTQGAAVP